MLPRMAASGNSVARVGARAASALAIVIVGLGGSGRAHHSRSDIDETTRDVRGLIPELDQRGVSQADLEAIRKLTQQLDQARFNGGSQLLDRELKANLALLEQLELRLAKSLQNDRAANVRTAVAERVPEEYKDAVAEYYRRLSKEK